uniref:Uncharacterized protein n=1 Tax=Gopherus agassizii TaxID=38772 RepID=A0A452GQF1_9SAUR
PPRSQSWKTELPRANLCSPLTQRECKVRLVNLTHTDFPLTSSSHQFPAYRTVCGVNGPLVVLDNVKVTEMQSLVLYPMSNDWAAWLMSLSPGKE